MTDRYLTIYLRDHLAMAQGGIEFVERAAQANKENSLGGEFDQMYDELGEETDAVLEAMDLLKVEPSQIKRAGAWIAEKAGRLKFNGEFRRYSPLSRVLEIEFMMAAVQARKGLWMTLQDARKLYSELDGLPMEQFANRADDQLARLENMHLQAVRSMLKSGQGRDEDRDRPQPR